MYAFTFFTCFFKIFCFFFCSEFLHMIIQNVLFFVFLVLCFLVQTQVEPVKNLTKLNSGTTQKPQAWKSLKILKPAWKCPSKIQNRPAQNSIVLFCFCNVLAN